MEAGNNIAIEQTGIATVANRQFWLVNILVATTVVPLSGCGASSQQGADSPQATASSGDITPAAFHDLDAESLLVGVFQRYRAAESYSDAAQVCLAYEIDGRTERQWAPLSVRLDRRNFYVEAYSLRCHCDSRQTLAWIKDESTHDFDHQVSIGPAPSSRIEWEKLTLDPIFQQQLAAGLGGPPPQLDWLFAAQPMKRLFDQKHTFEFGAKRRIENRHCQSVIVRADARSYTFWIDLDAGIVREVELPSVFAPPTPTLPPQEMTLTVQLTGATFQPGSEPPTIDPLPTQPKYVETFVPLPPDEPNRLLGMKLDRTLQQSVDAASGRADASLVVCFRDPKISFAVLDLLTYWHQQLPSDVAERIRVLQVRPTLSGNSSVSRDVIADPDRWASMFGSPVGGIGIVSRSGKLLWTQAVLVPAELPALGTIVVDTLKGVDVPGRLRREWRTAEDAYESEIARRYRPPN